MTREEELKLLTDIESLCDGKDAISVLGAATVIMIFAAHDSGRSKEQVLEALSGSWDEFEFARDLVAKKSTFS